MTYAIDTLPRPVTTSPLYFGAGDRRYGSGMGFHDRFLTVCYDAAREQDFALVPIGNAYADENAHAIAALPEWIAEAERWRRTASLLAADLAEESRPGNLALRAETLAKAYERAGAQYEP